MSEEWRTCIEDPHYEVSSVGRVRGKTRTQDYPASWRAQAFQRTWQGKILRPTLLNTGYCQVCLTLRQKHSVHRLVASAFIPNPDALPEVNHKNGTPSDNRVENLEWVTHSDNLRHAFRELGRLTPNKGNGRLITFDGSSRTIRDWAEHTGLPVTMIHCRLSRGWSAERALTTPSYWAARQVSNSAPPSAEPRSGAADGKVLAPERQGAE